MFGRNGQVDHSTQYTCSHFSDDIEYELVSTLANRDGIIIQAINRESFPVLTIKETEDYQQIDFNQQKNADSIENIKVAKGFATQESNKQVQNNVETFGYVSEVGGISSRYE